MSVRITYFVHGTSVDNEDGISSGWNDAPLSVLGVKQSEELKKILDSSIRWNDRKPNAVFSSDLVRAAHTARIVFGDSVILDARLRECNYGAYNGKPTNIVEPMQETRITERFPEGESYEDVKKRIAEFLGFLKREYDGKHVALVGHKAPQLSLELLLNGKTWTEAFVEDWRKAGAWRPGWEYRAQ